MVSSKSRFGPSVAVNEEASPSRRREDGGQRRRLANKPTRLCVERDLRGLNWSENSEAEPVSDSKTTDTTTTEEGSRRKARWSPRSEVILVHRVQELSKLESPLLRELAQRLGAMLQIETPRYLKKFKHPYTDLYVGDRWQAFQGGYSWKGLLEPDFDPVLKGEVLRYGEFAQATYDAFDKNKNSKYFGTCRYLKPNLLEKVGLENRGYEITNFLYATTNIRLFPHFLAGPDADSNREDSSSEPEKEIRTHNTDQQETSERYKSASANSRQCNWIGFVAVCTSPEEIARLGRRDIVIAWRGSVTTFDYIADMMDYMSPAEFGPDIASSRVRVEKGFVHLYTSTNPRSRYCRTKSARHQVHDAIKALVRKYKDEGPLSITVTGHSLGSALATLSAYDITECEIDQLSSSVSSEWGSVESPRKANSPRDHPHRHHHSPRVFSKDALPAKDQGIGREGDNECANPNHRTTPEPLNKSLTRQNQFVNKFRRDRIPVTVYSFGGPRVGNRAFADRVNELGVAVLRVANVHDIVTKLPGLMKHHLIQKLGHMAMLKTTYKHVGVKLTVDNELSSFLQRPAGIGKSHSLEGYLHLVDSYQGIKTDHAHETPASFVRDLNFVDVLKTACSGRPDRSAVAFRNKKYKPYRKTFRDHALVNKYKDYLKPEFSIPPCWWQEQNKGLVKNANGEWGPPDRDETIPGTPSPSEEDEQLERHIDTACEKSSTPHHGDRLILH